LAVMVVLVDRDSTSILLAALAGLLLVPFCSGRADLGPWPPFHVNHTFPDAVFEGDDFTLRVVAVGDCEGVEDSGDDVWRAREVIVWMVMTNRGVDSKEIVPRYLKFRVDGGPWRQCFYHRWSDQTGSIGCSGVVSPHWRHGSYVLGPGESVPVWAVFRLPKYQYDHYSEIAIEYWKENVEMDVEISGDRVPLDIPYILMDKPGEGEEVWTLRDVKFRVADSDWVFPVPRRIAVNWSISVDGSVVKTGTGEQYDSDLTVCPIGVKTSLGSLDLGRGVHVFTVRVWNGRVNGSRSVNFTTLYGRPPMPMLSECWAINVSGIFEDRVFGGGDQGCQTVWDVDGDGVREIVFGTRRGDSDRLWCFGSGQGFEWVYPPPGEEGLSGAPISKVSLVDVDGDGVYELCLGGRGRLLVLDGDGHLVWSWDEPERGSMNGAPQAMDVDGDGFVEFFLNSGAGYLHRVSYDGELVWSFPTGAGNLGHPTICDMDQDGLYDVVWACQDGRVYCIDASTGKEEWRFDAGARMHASNVIVADIDGDGGYEALTWVGPPVSAVICLDAWGNLSWSWELPAGGISGSARRFRISTGTGLWIWC